MTPFHPQFRRLLRRNIPQLSDEMLNRFEQYTGLRHQLVQESHIMPTPKDPSRHPPIQDFENDISYTTIQAQQIVGPYASRFDTSLRLWTARRELALQQGNFFQVPLTPRHFRKFLTAILRYWGIQVQTFFPLTWNRGKYYFENLSVGRVLVIIIMVGLMLLSWFYSIR